MRNEFFRDLGYEPREPSEDMFLENKHRSAICDILEFLTKEQNVPSKNINRVSGLVLDLINSRWIDVEMDYTDSYTYLVFVRKRKDISRSASLISPKNYLEQIKQDPITQVCSLIQAASFISDYWLNRENIESKKIMTKRSFAYISEFLQTIRKKFRMENKFLFLTVDEAKIIADYPKGINSLDPKYIYFPPEYKSPFYDG